MAGWRLATIGTHVAMAINKNTEDNASFKFSVRHLMKRRMDIFFGRLRTKEIESCPDILG